MATALEILGTASFFLVIILQNLIEVFDESMLLSDSTVEPHSIRNVSVHFCDLPVMFYLDMSRSCFLHVYHVILGKPRLVVPHVVFRVNFLFCSFLAETKSFPNLLLSPRIIATGLFISLILDRFLGLNRMLVRSQGFLGYS